MLKYFISGDIFSNSLSDKLFSLFIIIFLAVTFCKILLKAPLLVILLLILVFSATCSNKDGLFSRIFKISSTFLLSGFSAFVILTVKSKYLFKCSVILLSGKYPAFSVLCLSSVAIMLFVTIPVTIFVFSSSKGEPLSAGRT